MPVLPEKSVFQEL